MQNTSTTPAPEAQAVPVIERITTVDIFAARKLTKAQLIQRLWSATYALEQIDRDSQYYSEFVADEGENVISRAVAYRGLEHGVRCHMKIYHEGLSDPKEVGKC